MGFIKHRGYHEIPVEVDEGESYTISAVVPTEADFRRPIADLAFPPFGQNAVIIGWSGEFLALDGRVPLLPDNFTAANWAEFTADACIEGAIWRAIGKLRAEALSGELLRKNSPAPPATGPAAEAGKTPAG